MSWFSNLKLFTKMIVSICAVLVLTCILGLFSILQLSSLHSTASDVSTNWMPAIGHISNLNTNTTNLRLAEFEHVTSLDAPDMQQAEQSIKETLATIQKNRDSYALTIVLPEEKALWDQFIGDYQLYIAEHDKLLQLSKSGKKEDALAMLHGSSEKAYDKATDTLAKLVQLNIDHGAKAANASNGVYASAKVWIALMITISIVAGLALAWYVANLIITPIRTAVRVAERVAEGDLTTAIQVESRDETGQLLGALRTMTEKLTGIVNQVRSSSDSISTGSAQIASGNADLSQRTEEQAANLEQTAASMEQLNATVKNNADSARQATQLASSASAVAVKGGEVVGQVVATMDQIAASSRQIADIIGTIDGIAFQTNILALNAAVEAARAGEQGRGFAVVAAEVRNLAQRSSEASKQIRQLISASVERVEDGSRLVSEAGTTMSDIVSQVKRVNDLIGEINAATTEQTSGIEQVGNAVSQLDQATQQNAALVEESAAAAESLKQQAHALVDAVAVFRTGSHGHATMSPAHHTAFQPTKSRSTTGTGSSSAHNKAKAPPKPVAKTPSAQAPSSAPRPVTQSQGLATAGAGAGADHGWETF